MGQAGAQPVARKGSGLRARLAPFIASIITSMRLRDLRRGCVEQLRRGLGRRHDVHYFHQVDDPYSALTAQILKPFAVRYDVRLIPHLAPPPEDWAAPDRARLDAYALRDARAVAPAYGLAFAGISNPGADRTRRAQAILSQTLAEDRFPEAAAEVTDALWSGEDLDDLAARFGEADPKAVHQALDAGARRRRRAGHYLGATFHYAGEWYWGVDRLAYLEALLAALGADRFPGAPLVAARPAIMFAPPPNRPVGSPPLELFLSLRSPYSWLVIERAQTLADHYGLRLILKPVLPMVMRGLPVPLAKRLYIVVDCKREAERLGLPFGRICDPVGAPVERGLAILAGARASGRDVAFAASFLKGVFAEGVDAGSDRGLEHLCRRAGVTGREAGNWMADDGWREEAEANRREMADLSLWGVPSLRFGDTSVWGQDRLWLIERAIIETLDHKTGGST